MLRDAQVPERVGHRQLAAGLCRELAGPFNNGKPRRRRRRGQSGRTGLHRTLEQRQFTRVLAPLLRVLAPLLKESVSLAALAVALVVLLPAVPAKHLEPDSGEVAGTRGFRRGCNRSALSAGGSGLTQPVAQQRCLRSRPAGCGDGGGPAENSHVTVD